MINVWNSLYECIIVYPHPLLISLNIELTTNGDDMGNL